MTIGPDTVISPYCYLMGRTEIGQDVFIGPHVVIKDSIIEDGVSIEGFTSLDGVTGGGGRQDRAVLAHEAEDGPQEEREDRQLRRVEEHDHGGGLQGEATSPISGMPKWGPGLT